MISENKSYDKFKMFLSINNIKQKELAEKLGRSQSFINNVLNGRGAKFTIEDVKMIRCIFEIKISEYL